jgi:hypothetical protein
MWQQVQQWYLAATLAQQQQQHLLQAARGVLGPCHGL